MRINIYKFNLVSSSYLLVFGDDRVHGTCGHDVDAGGSGGS